MRLLNASVLLYILVQVVALPIPDRDDDDDPLKFIANGESSFPNKPLTITTANMCDKDMLGYQRNKPNPKTKQSAAINMEWGECLEDKTCVSCPRYQSTYKRGLDLIAAFRDPAAKRARQTVFKNAFHDVPYNMVMIMGVNFGQIHLFLNWVCSADAASVDVRRFVVMAPSDERAKRVIEDAGFITIDLSWQKKLTKPIAVEYKGCTNCLSTGHGDINNIVTLLAGELVDAGYDTITQDVDFVWMGDPRPFLKRARRGRDLMACDAHRKDAHGPGNTGFIFYVSNHRTKIFINSLCNILPLKQRSDQLVFNHLLRHPNLRGLAFVTLPYSFADQMMKWNTPPSYFENKIAIHIVADKKEDKLLKSNGAFFYTEKCSVYLPSLWPCGVNKDKCWENSPALSKYTAEESNEMRARERARQQKSRLTTTSHLVQEQLSCKSTNPLAGNLIKPIDIQSTTTQQVVKITIIPKVHSAFLRSFAKSQPRNEDAPEPYCKEKDGRHGGIQACIAREYAKDPHANICGPCQCHGCKLVTPAGAGFDAGPSLKLAFVLDPVERFVAAFADLYIHRKESPFGPVAPKDLVKGAALQQQFDKFTDAYIAGKIPDEPSFSKHYPGPFTAQLGYISHHDYDFIGLGGTKKFADEWNGIVHEKYGMPLMGDNHRAQLSSSDNSFGITVSGKQHRMLCLVYARDYCCIAPLAANIPPECMGPDESNDPVAWCKTVAKTPNTYSWLQ